MLCVYDNAPHLVSPKWPHPRVYNRALRSLSPSFSLLLVTAIRQQYYLVEDSDRIPFMSQQHRADRRPRRSDPIYYTKEHFSPSYVPGGELRRHEHANPPLLPSINHPERMRRDVHWYSQDEFDTMVENSRQPRRPTEGFEPFGRRGMKPVRDQRVDLQLADLFFGQGVLCRQHP